MANYPFKINIQTGDGSQLTYYTSSFANSGQTQVSASVIVSRINAMKKGDSYIQSDVAVATSSGLVYNTSGQGATFLNVSTNENNTGSIIFTDTEISANGGLDFYTFHGTKVCSTLGLPEGIPIYTENFRLSDDSSNPDNYLSGDVIAESVAIKQGFKMAPSARMRSNIIWDEVFGEGFIQWLAGANSRLIIGYDDATDEYKIAAAASTTTFNISGVDTLTADDVVSTGRLDVTSGGGSGQDVVIGTQGAGNTDTNDHTKGSMRIDTDGNNSMTGHMLLRGNESSPFEDVDQLSQAGTITHDGNGNNYRDYQLNILNMNSDAAHRFAGISFLAGTDLDTDTIGASIAAVRDISADGNSALADHNLVFCTNDAASDGNKEKLVIFHDGEVRAKNTVSASLFRSSGDVVAFYTSDERLKDNVRTISEPIYKLQQLRGVEYEWNDKQDIYQEGTKDSGIIAQDVEKVLPQLVKENSNGYLGVRHDRLVGLLIESVKDQQKQIDDLKREVKELKDG